MAADYHPTKAERKANIAYWNAWVRRLVALPLGSHRTETQWREAYRKHLAGRVIPPAQQHLLDEKRRGPSA